MLLVQVSLILFVASIGLRARWQDVLGSLSNAGTLFRNFIAIYVIVPIVAVVACVVLPIHYNTRLGIVIMAVSPLAPFVAAKMVRVGLTPSKAISLYVSMILIAVVAVPLTVAVLGAIFSMEVSVSAFAVAKLIFVSVVMPLGLALVISAVVPKFSLRIAPTVNAIGSIGLLLFVVLLLFKTGRQMIDLIGDGTIVAISVTVIAGLVSGHLLGGSRRADRESLALAADARHPGIAMLIANSNSKDEHVLLAIVLFFLVSIILSAAYQQWMKRWALRTPNDAMSH